MSEAWQCPDCAEEVAGGVIVCPYCGFRASADEGGTAAVGAALAGVASSRGASQAEPTGTSAGTREARYGRCPSCQSSQWEGAPGRCAVCGTGLQQITTIEVPVEVGSGARPAVSAARDGQPSGSAADGGQPASPVEATRPAASAADDAIEPESLETAELEPLAPAAATTTQASVATDDASQIAILRELAALRDEGIITTVEFEAKKAEILRRL